MFYCNVHKVYYWGGNKRHNKCKVTYLGYYSPSRNDNIQNPVIKHFYEDDKFSINELNITTLKANELLELKGILKLNQI